MLKSMIVAATLVSGLYSGILHSADAVQKLRLLSANTAAETGIINSLAKKYMERNPGVSVEIETAGALSVLDRARQGRGDMVITHHPRAEELFISDGFGSSRTMVMYNSFAIIGPKDDPLGISKERDLLTVLRKLAKEQVMFIVPGQRSGTTTRLNELWSMVNVEASWAGYESTEASAKATLQNADLYEAYTFADLGTYFANQDKVTSIRPLYRDNIALNNYYSAIVVNGKQVKGTNQKLAEDFLDFLVSDQTQDDILQFGMTTFKTELYTPAAQLDKGLRERRLQAEIEKKNGYIFNLYVLGIIIVVTLMVVIILLMNTRRLASRYAMSEERYRLAAEVANDGLYDWDIKGGAAFFSQRFRALLGIVGVAEQYQDPSGVLIKHIDKMYRTRTQAKLNYIMTATADKSFTADFRPANPGLANRWLLMRGHVIRDTNGKPLRMFGVLTDMTDAHNRGNENAPDMLHPVKAATA